MKQLTTILLLIASLSVFSQEDGKKGISEDGPTLCECAQNTKKDKNLLSRCNQKFDFNSMSPGDQYRMEEKIKRCSDPEPCDCIERKDDPFIVSACEEKFDTTQMDSAQLADYKASINGCVVFETDLDIRDVCECVNSDPDDEDVQQRCQEMYDVSKMTEEEREEFISMIDECVANKDNPEFLLTVCDCIGAPEDDLELLESCASKFDIISMTSEERQQLHADAKDCFDISNISIQDYCDCFTGKSTSKGCEKLMEQMDKQFENASPEMQQRLIDELTKCFE